MSKTNAQIVREFIEQVPNAKRLELFDQYFSPDCIVKTAPYVGLGVILDDTSGERVVVKDVSPTGPVARLLQPDDEIVQVSDSGRNLTTFQELKSMTWGQGKRGTRLTVTVRRAEQMVEIPITRGLVQERSVPLAVFFDGWRHFLLNEMPDYRSEIQVIIGEGDLVGCYTLDSGTSSEYQQSAVWPAATFYRLEDGKIVEIWGVDDALAQHKQLGFQLVEPVREKTP